MAIFRIASFASKRRLLFMVVVLLQIITSITSGLGLLRVTINIENEMTYRGQQLKFQCWSGTGPTSQVVGPKKLNPFNHFVWTFTKSVFGGTSWTCTFDAPNKPTTTIDVFRGYYYMNTPCHCSGVTYCAWQVLNDGFWCNTIFVQKWGRA